MRPLDPGANPGTVHVPLGQTHEEEGANLSVMRLPRAGEVVAMAGKALRLSRM